MLDGFKTTVRAGMDIPADFVARVDVVMELGSINETLTVVGTNPVVDVTNTRGGHTIRTEVQARVIPMMGGPADLARLVPGVTASFANFNPGVSGQRGTGYISAYGQPGTTVGHRRNADDGEYHERQSRCTLVSSRTFEITRR